MKHRVRISRARLIKLEPAINFQREGSGEWGLGDRVEVEGRVTLAQDGRDLDLVAEDGATITVWLEGAVVYRHPLPLEG